MKYKINLIIVLLFLSSSFLKSQTKPINLQVGKVVPPILISNVINNSNKSVNTSDFKDRLLILDFWNTMCKACIEGFPKMKDLQNQFGKKIKILPVTYESKFIIKKFLERNKTVRDLNMPIVIEDKILSKWFKSYASPHEVWIYKNKVIAITSGEYVDGKLIQKILDGEKLNLPIKDDFYNYNYDRPFLTLDKGHKNNQHSNLNYIALTGFQEGAKPTFASSKDPIGKSARTYFVNFSILQAYNILWQPIVSIEYINSPSMIESGGISPNQIILEVKNKKRFLFDASRDYQDSWHRQNDISYEWLCLDTLNDIKARNKIIISDLNRLLKLNGRWEKRKVKCLSLIRTDTIDRIKSHGGERIFGYKNQKKRFQNMELSNIVYFLNNYDSNPPVFNNTNYLEKVDLELDFKSWTDILSINSELTKYGLNLKEDYKVIDMFILTEM